MLVVIIGNVEAEEDADERYNFRRQVRSFIKWYGYLTQVCRMFDKDMQKEYVFLAYLIKLLPEVKTQMMDLEGALKLEFYKLEKTFKGDIQLDPNAEGVWEQRNGLGKSTPEEKEPLEEVIDRINMLYGGQFTDADKVIIAALHDKLIGDKKLAKNSLRELIRCEYPHTPLFALVYREHPTAVLRKERLLNR